MAENILECIFLKENIRILIQILQVIIWGLTDNKSALV